MKRDEPIGQESLIKTEPKTQQPIPDENEAPIYIPEASAMKTAPAVRQPSAPQIVTAHPPPPPSALNAPGHHMGPAGGGSHIDEVCQAANNLLK